MTKRKKLKLAQKQRDGLREIARDYRELMAKLGERPPAWQDELGIWIRCDMEYGLAQSGLSAEQWLEAMTRLIESSILYCHPFLEGYYSPEPTELYHLSIFSPRNRDGQQTVWPYRT